MTSAVGVSMDAERASGAAKRRRERRLRSWWRHERMTVTAELAVALHHSRGVGPAVPHEALRGQTPASSMGRRPGVLKEPVPPVVVEHAACPCSGAPLLVVPSLAAAESDGVDGTTLKYLLKLALKEQEKEHEKHMLALNRRVRDDLPLTPAEHAALKEWACRPLSSAGKRRKRKERRKRKLPRKSSRPRLVVRHLGRYGPEGHLCFDTETTSVARAVRTWKLGLSTSHWYLAPSCSVSVTPEEHRKFWSFLGDAYAELFLRPLVSGSHLCGVLYDPLYLTVTCSVFGFFWKMTSGISVCSTPWFDSRYMLGVSLQRPGPELQKTAVSTQLQFIAGHRHLFRSAEAVSSSWCRLLSRPQRFPSCCSMVDVSVMRGCRFSGVAVEKTSALPQLQLGLFLQPFVFGSHLFGVRLVEYIRKRSRIQRNAWFDSGFAR